MNMTKFSTLRKVSNDQDNLVSDPMFTVQEELLIWGIDPEYVDSDEDYVWDHIGGDHTRVYYKRTWKFVSVFFTREAAQDYIDYNINYLNNPRIYIVSGHDNREWKLVRKCLIDLNKGV